MNGQPRSQLQSLDFFSFVVKEQQAARVFARKIYAEYGKIHEKFLREMNGLELTNMIWKIRANAMRGAIRR